MNRRYALPAALALTAHAVLFLGFGSPPPTPPPVEKVADNLWSKLPKKLEEVEIVLREENRDDPAVEVPAAPKPAERPRGPADPRDADRPKVPDMSIPIEPGENSPVYNYGPDDGGPITPVKFVVRELRPTDLDTPPRMRNVVEPRYPAALKSAGIGGEVVVEFTVDEEGRVLNPRVVRSSHREFEGPTLDAVLRWRFAPGHSRGVPVRFRMCVPVAYHLDA